MKLLLIYNRDKGICGICGNPVPHPTQALEGRARRLAATRDHILPKSKGGTDKSSNLRLAHYACNSRRGNQLTVTDLLILRDGKIGSETWEHVELHTQPFAEDLGLSATAELKFRPKKNTTENTLRKKGEK